MDVISPDGTRVRYEIYGEGPTVILLHGSLMEGASWVHAGYVDALSGLRCVVVDCRGYGGSDRSSDPASYAIERYVEDVAAIADATRADRFALVGYSWGSAAAWHSTAALDGVSALVAIGGWHPNLYSFELDAMEKLRIQPMRDVGVEGFAGYMKAEEGPLPEWWERQVLASDSDSYIAQRYAAVSWTRLAPAHVTVPTLLISGATEDTDRDSLLVAGAVARGEAVIVDGAGHCQNFLARQTVEATKNFLEKNLR